MQHTKSAQKRMGCNGISKAGDPCLWILGAVHNGEFPVRLLQADGMIGERSLIHAVTLQLNSTIKQH